MKTRFVSPFFSAAVFVATSFVWLFLVTKHCGWWLFLPPLVGLMVSFPILMEFYHKKDNYLKCGLFVCCLILIAEILLSIFIF
jgi:putative effector of murein hydrolase